ncbi:MAG: hypothetical protein F4X97_07840 [Boseongicola sp. SB0662_bin_57]|nr:hypothetical protein [Boseongicola sp. SB0662_bin_57]
MLRLSSSVISKRSKITNEVHLLQELDFIHRFAHAIQAVCQTIDMPDRRARLSAHLALQSNGKFQVWQGYHSKEFKGGEIGAMEAEVRVPAAFDHQSDAAKNPGSNATR